jgi:hypothetical protein
MLRLVRKRFDVADGITAEPGDIMDVSELSTHRVWVMEEHNFLGPTDAKEATVSMTPPVEKKEASPTPVKNRPVKPKRSVLASRPRAFTRKAKQGD